MVLGCQGETFILSFALDTLESRYTINELAMNLRLYIYNVILYINRNKIDTAARSAINSSIYYTGLKRLTDQNTGVDKVLGTLKEIADKESQMAGDRHE